jgi:hypothetical protein
MLRRIASYTILALVVLALKVIALAPFLLAVAIKLSIVRSEVRWDHKWEQVKLHFWVVGSGAALDVPLTPAFKIQPEQ